MEFEEENAVLVNMADMALLFGRLLLSLLFLEEGIELAGNLDTTLAAMARLGVSAPIAIATIVLQLGAGFAIAFGLMTRLAAFGLGLFCVLTALLFHTNFASHNELLHFEKDLAIAGGMFALIVAGAGKLSLDMLIRRHWNTRLVA
ncbi:MULTISPECIES: DoxX family protein [Rhizobium]|uniref:DoxX family protein n=1 Tax=Rhizobium tropici TaxID=398 RepID=A0A6P1C558_RHITR|nr:MULTISPECIES: DoxX family protein [Rhizobium]AGB72311.1 quinol oxidase membrane protein subunit [Rhizobium tropici CIAT 899]MBB4243124.1 putative oxidoreductase [Rhizobium tropici]MBB5594767.1 putative oxidoreductase [Rhizobium tropici]MBB6493450.1 putative oxidoreductase [Rhizobium tropici]NEV11837.1 DoxX family protein [Rhizobium tropici]